MLELSPGVKNETYMIFCVITAFLWKKVSLPNFCICFAVYKVMKQKMDLKRGVLLEAEIKLLRTGGSGISIVLKKQIQL